MARRRRVENKLTAAQVAALVDARFPYVEWDPELDDDWVDHVARARAIRARRRALAAEHGYTALDLFFAEYPRGNS